MTEDEEFTAIGRRLRKRRKKMLNKLLDLFKRPVTTIKMGDTSIGYNDDPIDIYLMTRKDWIDRGIKSISFSYVNHNLLDELEKFIDYGRKVLREKEDAK